jgi:hypothetical protein
MKISVFIQNYQGLFPQLESFQVQRGHKELAYI